MGAEADVQSSVTNKNTHNVIRSAAEPADARPFIQPQVGVDTLIPPSTAGYNTKKLGQRLTVDGAAAATAGVLVAPIITMIDQYANALSTRSRMIAS